jgi:AcrR family transcriptional regulator
VLRAARDQFWGSGYAATSVDDIGAATGLGKGSLYGAFGDKHQLYLRVFDEYCARFVRFARRALEGPDAGAYERLCTYVVDVVEAAARDTARRGCLLANGAAELAGKDPTVADRARVALEQTEELMATCVAAAQREGHLDPQADPRQLAALLLAVLRGVEALGKAGRDPASLRSIAHTALATLPRPPTN